MPTRYVLGRDDIDGVVNIDQVCPACQDKESLVEDFNEIIRNHEVYIQQILFGIPRGVLGDFTRELEQIAGELAAFIAQHGKKEGGQ
jgi:hypothetical protein